MGGALASFFMDRGRATYQRVVAPGRPEQRWPQWTLRGSPGQPRTCRRYPVRRFHRAPKRTGRCHRSRDHAPKNQRPRLGDHEAAAVRPQPCTAPSRSLARTRRDLPRPSPCGSYRTCSWIGSTSARSGPFIALGPGRALACTVETCYIIKCYVKQPTKRPLAGVSSGRRR